jgi:DNA repair protein RecO (recombination protein O)
MAFQPLLIDWSGGGEVKTLVRAEWLGGQPLLGGQALLCGYYLNELMVRLTAREDAHPRLFAAFGEAIAALGRGDSPAVLLRRFELALLLELGYGLGLEHDADSTEPVRPERRYLYIIERGPVALADAEAAGADDLAVSGRTLLEMAASDFSRAETLVQAKLLLRALINHYLGGRELVSRRVLKELQEL